MSRQTNRGTIKCSRCGARVRVGLSYMTARGMACESCWSASWESTGVDVGTAKGIKP